ncbi:MAG TPA: hypothetical protein VGJ07_09220 [Rugosimonospora sp.]
MLIEVPETVRHEPPSTRGRRGTAWRGWGALIAAVALAWLLPFATHAAGVDLLLPPFIVAGLMAVQRGAAGMIDRLVLALVQLFGATCAAGLMITFWPWHLDPVPIAGLALTVLVLLAALTRRTRPAGTRRTRSSATRWLRAVVAARRPSSVLVVLAAAAVAAVAAYPFVVRDLAGRVGIMLTGEDITRHYLLYDVIGRTGGYLFLHPHVLRPYAPDKQLVGVANYPQGVHFGYAILDRFIRSADTAGGPVRSLDIMIWLMVASYALLGLAVLWSVRRVAGPGVGVVRLAPVLAVAATWLAFGDPVSVLSRGYPNEIVGLALNAVLTALVARPLWRLGDQTATVAALIVGIAFSYPLFLPFTAVAAAVWAARARLWRYWWAWVTLVALVPLVLVSPLAAMTGSAGNQLLLLGTSLPVDRPATVVLVVLAVAGLVVRRGTRSPSGRAALACVVTAGAFAAGLAVYQTATVGHPVYYFNKLLHLLIVVALSALGGAARLMPRGARLADGRVRYAWRLVPGVALAMPIVFAMVAYGGEYHETKRSVGLQLATGRYTGSPTGGRDAILMAGAYPDGGGAVDVDLRGDVWRNWYGTMLASALQGRYRYEPEWYDFLSPTGKPKTFADLDKLVAASPVPVRFFVRDPAASMLVVDADHPVREAYRPGKPRPINYGDSGAPTDIEAVRLLAAQFPGKVRVVYPTAADR